METTVQPASNLRGEALKNGLIWAAINITVFLISFYVKPSLMGSFAWGGLQFLIGIALASYFCVDLRKKAGGFWVFKEALSNIFIMFIVQALAVFFFTVLFAKVEPSYIPKMKSVLTKTTTEVLEKTGMDQEKIDEMTEKNDEIFDKQLNPGIKEILITVGTSVVMYFIGALIFAAIFKKDPPFFIKKEDVMER